MSCEICGAQGVNLKQQKFYYGHYKYHRAKAQHVLEADGMAYSFTCPICTHEASVLCPLARLLSDPVQLVEFYD
jgi:hypothetical protein